MQRTDAFIEVDGLMNHWEEVALNDIHREEALKNAGFSVLRFDDEDILDHFDDFFYKIGEFIEEFEKNHRL